MKVIFEYNHIIVVEKEPNTSKEVHKRKIQQERRSVYWFST